MCGQNKLPIILAPYNMNAATQAPIIYIAIIGQNPIKNENAPTKPNNPRPNNVFKI